MAPQPAPFARHSSGTNDVLQTTTPAMSTTDTANGTQKLHRPPVRPSIITKQQKPQQLPFQDPGDLLEEIRPLDLLLRRGPRHRVRAHVRQHRLPDRYTQPSKEKEAAPRGRGIQNHDRQEKRGGLTRTVSMSRSPRFRQTSIAVTSPSVSERERERGRTTHQLLLAQPVLQQRVSQIAGTKEHDRRREPDLKAVDVKPVHG
jgi:hypothetical protein